MTSTTQALALPDQWRQRIQQYTDKEYLVLAPLELGPVPAMHTPMASVVKIDPSPDAGDVQEPQPGKFQYSKSALDRIAAAAGISWLAEMCGRTDAGTDPEIVRFRMAGKRKELDGQWRVVIREYEFDLKARKEELEESVKRRDWIQKITDPAKRAKAIEDAVTKDMIQMRKFKVQRAESGAANRVIRVFLGIKSSYTKEQIARPVIVPKLVFTPDYSDPEVKRFMLAEATGTIQELYAAQAGAGSYSQPIVVPESPAELEAPKRTAIAEASLVQEPSGKPQSDQPDPNLVDEAAFREAYNAEEEAPGDLKTAMVSKQVGILKAMMDRKGFEESRLKNKAIETWERKHRLEFFQRLLETPDKQAELPWDK